MYFEEEKGLKFLESIVRYLYKSTNIEVNKVINATKTISERGGEVTMTTAMKLFERVSGIESIERLHVIKEAIKIAKNLEEISKLLEG